MINYNENENCTDKQTMLYKLKDNGIDCNLLIPIEFFL